MRWRKPPGGGYRAVDARKPGAPPGSAQRRSQALDDYQKHIRELGYKGEEVTLLMIGYAQGWDESASGPQA